MPVNILADENVNFNIIRKLRDHDFNIVSVLEDYPGICDKTVLKIAKEYNYILLTEDSDFGELIFSDNCEKMSVIFIRYHYNEVSEITRSLLHVLKKYDFDTRKFITLSPKKIRVREY